MAGLRPEVDVVARKRIRFKSEAERVAAKRARQAEYRRKRGAKPRVKLTSEAERYAAHKARQAKYRRARGVKPRPKGRQWKPKPTKRAPRRRLLAALPVLEESLDVSVVVAVERAKEAARQSCRPWDELVGIAWLCGGTGKRLRGILQRDTFEPNMGHLGAVEVVSEDPLVQSDQLDEADGLDQGAEPHRS